jgi:ubiquitin C-terminal hydrolase
MMLDMAPYAFHRNAPAQYQLGGIIAHIGLPQDNTGHYKTFLRIYGQWFLFDGTEVQSVSESAALNDNFPEAVWSTQTASILLYVLPTE